jgi:hypothetical protein
MEEAIGRMAADSDARQQMEIHASLALSLMFTEGNNERVRDAFNWALTYWFTGNLDLAVGYAKMTIEEAARSDHPIALSRTLILTMPLYFWIDDLPGATAVGAFVRIARGSGTGARLD